MVIRILKGREWGCKVVAAILLRCTPAEWFSGGQSPVLWTKTNASARLPSHPSRKQRAKDGAPTLVCVERMYELARTLPIPGLELHSALYLLHRIVPEIHRRIRRWWAGDRKVTCRLRSLV